jgi:D-alanine-D-alanine ligase-like ATP-grasp enzyme
MSGERSEPFMPAIFKRLARRLKATVFFEPEYQIVGRIRFANGRQSYFWHNRFNLNPVSSARLANDKGYTSFFLQADGIPIPRWRTFFDEERCETLRTSRNLAAAARFAAKLGWPVYVKPCRGSQGAGVERVANSRELAAAAHRIFRKTHTLLMQEACPGRDYRLVVLDGEIISGYERVPLAIVGDGRSTVMQLMRERQRGFRTTGRDTEIDFGDHRWRANLTRLRLKPTSVLTRGRSISLLEVANLSCGGEAIDVTEKVHPFFAKVAARAAASLDLRFAGIDIIAPDITRQTAPYFVLEVNSAPGLDHYAGQGEAHERHIDDLYLRVLRAIERGPTPLHTR